MRLYYIWFPLNVVGEDTTAFRFRLNVVGEDTNHGINTNHGIDTNHGGYTNLISGFHPC